MTRLNEVQETMLQKMRQMFVSLTPVLEDLETEYDKADYLTKKPLRDAVTEARAAGIPMSTIVKDGTGFPYVKKLEQWLYPPEWKLERIAALGDREGELHFEVDISSVEAVTRLRTGEFEVLLNGDTYLVPAIGSELDIMADRDPDMPQEVYDLIETRHPGFVVLEEED